MKKTAFNPFLFYSHKLQALLTKASSQTDPALWLYNHDVRTILFMLEALTRLHNNAFDEKVFDKWNKRFKKLEDIFGQIDNYRVLELKFESNKNIPKTVIKYFTINEARLLEKCNQRLKGKEWLSTKMQFFDDEIREYAFTYDNAYSEELRFAITKEIDKILYFSLKNNYEFTKIEEQIHEIRRKIRWLSMYVQAARGLIQLKKSQTSKSKNNHINYFTKEVLGSSYNIVEVKPKNVQTVLFDHDSFFGLSWIINELGNLKDLVLDMYQLRDAIFVTQDLSIEEATKKAILALGLKPTVEQDTLKKASRLIENFVVKDKMLDGLLIK